MQREDVHWRLFLSFESRRYEEARLYAKELATFPTEWTEDEIQWFKRAFTTEVRTPFRMMQYQEHREEIQWKKRMLQEYQTKILNEQKQFAQEATSIALKDLLPHMSNPRSKCLLYFRIGELNKSVYEYAGPTAIRKEFVNLAKFCFESAYEIAQEYLNPNDELRLQVVLYLVHVYSEGLINTSLALYTAQHAYDTAVTHASTNYSFYLTLIHDTILQLRSESGYDEEQVCSTTDVDQEVDDIHELSDQM